MFVLIVFIITFVIYFLVDYLFLKNSKKFKIDEFKYLKKRFNLSKNMKETKTTKLTCSILNASIMGIVCAIILYCNFNYLISVPLAFALIFLLIYSVYGIYGNILKGIDKNEKNN